MKALLLAKQVRDLLFLPPAPPPLIQDPQYISVSLLLEMTAYVVFTGSSEFLKRFGLIASIIIPVES